MDLSNLSKQALLDRKLCNRSLYYLCKEVLGYKDMVPHVHGDLCEFMTASKYGRDRQATVPRSWFKTWVCTVGKSIWLSLPDEEELFTNIYPHKGPDVRILIASNVVTNAEKMINKIKAEWMNNDRLKAAYPDLIPEFNKTRWSDSCAQIKRKINATEGTYTAVGVGGSVISQHFDHIIEDDLIYAKKDDFTGQELMPGQEDIDNAIGWHKLTYSLLANPKQSTRDNVGTRWAPHDLIDYIREKESSYACFEISATKNALWPIPDDTFCVWPERYDKVTLQSIWESQGNRIAETQYLGRPRAGQDIVFEIGYLKKHAHLDEYPQNLKCVTLVDLASWKDKRKICNNVVLTGGRDSSNHLWISRVDAGRYTPTQVIEIIKEHVKQFNSKVYVEEVGYQVSLRHFARKDMETSGFIYDINALPSDNRANAKDLRIHSLQPVIKNGFLHILSGMKLLMTELEDYPHCATKDIIDLLGFLHRYAKADKIAVPRSVPDPFCIEELEKELKSRAHSARGLPFDIQLSGINLN